MLKWGDWLLYGLLISLAVILFLVPGLDRPAAARAVLLHENKELLVIPARELAAGGSLELDLSGYHYEITYTEGRIRFAAADCPDKVCVRTGWISRAGQIAVCVPGQLIIKLEGPDPADSGQVDVVVG